MIVVSNAERIPYVLKRERELSKERRSIFFLRPLKTSVVARIQDSQATMTQDGVFGFRTAQATLEILKEGLVGWENVVDERGEQVPFRTQGASDKPAQVTIDQIPIEEAKELALAIEAGARLTEDEEKN